MRGWIDDVGNYSVPVAIGRPMRALIVGEIIASINADVRPGEIVSGWFDLQDFAAVDTAAIVGRVTEADLPPLLALGYWSSTASLPTFP